MASLTFRQAGLDRVIQDVKNTPARSNISAYRAINKALSSSYQQASAQIVREIAFPAGYLGNASNPNSRLALSKKASSNDLQGIISARRRPTSLARFAKAGAGGKLVSVGVKGGVSATVFKRAFIIRLRSGQGISEDNFNLGLAIRLRRGETLHGSTAARQIAPGLYLLYGPSVDQAFQGVRNDIAPYAAQVLRTEYLRQMALGG